jgi:hypothetical protein
MTAINFPNSPSVNDEFTASGRTWIYDGTVWNSAPYADDIAAAITAQIVDSAPATLDTLNELAAALGDDADFAGTVTAALGNKQDKVTGVSDTEIGYLDGVTSAIQTQINGKLSATITDPATGQTLQYNGTAWVNAAPAAGGETISSFLLMGA